MMIRISNLLLILATVVTMMFASSPAMAGINFLTGAPIVSAASSATFGGKYGVLKAVDLTGDGVRDLIIAQPGVGVHIYTWTAAGWYFNFTWTHAGSYASLDAADWDGDGLTDILISTDTPIAAANGGTVFIWENTGTPTAPFFNSTQYYDIASVAAPTAKFMDMDNMVPLEVVHSGSGGATPRVTIWDTTVPTTPVIAASSANGSTRALAVGNYNGDAFDDVAVAIGASWAIYSNSSSYTMTCATGSFVDNIGALVTLKGSATSADDDLAMGTQGTSSDVFSPDAGANCLHDPDISLPNSGISVKGMAVADLDGDGFDEIFVGRAAAPGQLYISDPTGAGVYTDDWNTGGTPTYHWVEFVDIDNDGNLDIAASTGTGIDWYISQGVAVAPTFPPCLTQLECGSASMCVGGFCQNRDAFKESIDLVPLASDVEEMVLADLDLDGDLDLVAATANAAAKGLEIFENTNGTSFTQVYANGEFANVPGKAVALGDCDFDGDQDVVYLQQSDPSTPTEGGIVLFYRNESAPGAFNFTWRGSTKFLGGDFPVEDVVVGDFDGDGLLNAAVLRTFNIGDETVVEYFKSDNDCNWLPDSGVSTPGLTQGKSLALVEFDGALALAIAGRATEVGWLCPDFVSGAYVCSVLLDGGTGVARAVSLHAADITGDGNQEVIIGNDFPTLGRNRPYQLIPGSPNTTNLLQLFGSGAQITQDLAFGDLNGDGFMDIAECNAAGAYPDRVIATNDMTGEIWVDPSSDATTACEIGDIDGDGDLDLISAYGGASRRIVAHTGFGGAYPALGDSLAWGGSPGFQRRDGAILTTMGSKTFCSPIWAIRFRESPSMMGR